jgi:hypothetical protein
MEAASVQTVGAPTQRRRSKGIPERRLAKLMVAPSMILIAIVLSAVLGGSVAKLHIAVASHVDRSPACRLAAAGIIAEADVKK